MKRSASPPPSSAARASSQSPLKLLVPLYSFGSADFDCTSSLSFTVGALAQEASTSQLRPFCESRYDIMRVIMFFVRVALGTSSVKCQDAFLKANTTQQSPYRHLSFLLGFRVQRKFEGTSDCRPYRCYERPGCAGPLLRAKGCLIFV